MSEVPQRRVEDQRIDQVVREVTGMKTHVAELTNNMAALKDDLKRNNETTDQIRDLLGTFRITAAIGKWVGMVGAGVVAIWQGWDLFRK